MPHHSAPDDHSSAFEELKKRYKKLQDRVTQGLVLQQKLFSIRDELDQELDRYRIIQEFNQKGLITEQIDDFATLVSEYFVKAFEQPHCLFAAYLKESDQFQVLSFFGFSKESVPSAFRLNFNIKDNNNATMLSPLPEVKASLHFLDLTEGLIAPLIGPEQQLKGIVLCGQQKQNQRFYPPISTKLQPSFMVLANHTAYLLHQFEATELLKNEIRERKRIEKILEAQATELRRSNEELEQFAYVVSHDLKAPLYNLKGFVKLLADSDLGTLSDTGKKYLNIIQKEVIRFESMIVALLRYARLSSGRFERTDIVDFNYLLEKVRAQVPLLLQQRKCVIKAEGLPKLKANSLQMEQLMLNLILNAIKFTPDERSPEILIRARKTEQGYIISLKDNGVGLPKEAGDSIFRLFKRLDSKVEREGQGIGLSICQKIVNQHGGKIWAESEGRNKGTTFYFTIQDD